MNGVDSMFDIEQLRSSIIEQSIPSSIAQIHQWIDVNGTTMMKSNQKLPFNFKEAEELRKLHEKIELKCMKFLAFYAHMNLKAIPEEYESMRQSMDIAIHNFSERVKSRRHVVVSFFTFYRHLNELTNMFKKVREEDHTRLPDALPDVEGVIEKYHNSTNLCLKKFSHLKDEANRVKASLEAVIKRDNESPSKIIDHIHIKKALKHIDELLQQTELELVSCYESQHLLEMEIKIEAKMMLIEDEINRSSSWIRKIIDFIRTRYNDNVVGKCTVENDILQDKNKDLIKKLEMAHEYGCRLHQLYSKFCEQLDRETERGDTALSKFDELWNSTEPISAQYTDRLKIAGNLFHNLDTTLERVEDLLMAINKDKESIDKRDSIYDKYQPKFLDVHSEYLIIKKVANNLFLKLQLDLQNKKLLPKHSSASEIEQTEDMVKMKIFTLSVKIKALDRCLNNGETITMTFTSPKERSTSESTDYDNAEIFDIIKKYLAFLNSSLLSWESKPLPKTLEQAKKSIESHKKLAEQSGEYWNDIQKTLAQYYDSSKNFIDDKELKGNLSEAENQKRKWDKKWHSHLKKKLDPRLQLLFKIQSFSDVLGDDMRTLDDFVTRPNHSLPLVNDLKDDLERMAMDPKSEHLQKLSDEAHATHKSDFDNIINSLNGKVNSYFDRLHQFLELERMIQEIHEFLPRLTVFKSEWHRNVDMHRDNPVEMAELKDEAKQIHNHIDQFNIDRLRKLATAIYGSSKRVEWLIDELVVDFSIPKQHRTISASHKVVESKIKPLNQEALPSSNLKTSDKKLILVNAESNNPTKLDFELESLPRLEGDQYDIQWYKDDRMIVPDRDSRIVVHCDPRSGKLSMKIDNCQESDAGKYWCEIKNNSSVVKKSSPVLLSVFTLKQGTVVPQFSDKTYGAVGDPMSFKLNLEGFKYAPETDLIFNNKPVNVNHASCKWSRISNNEVLEFRNSSVTPNDKGQYLFRVSGNVVAKTQVDIGEKPEFIHHKFIENCPLGNSIKISIPMKTNINTNSENVFWKKNNTPLTSSKLNYKTYTNATGDLVLEIPKFTEAYVGDYSCQVSNEFGADTFQLDMSIAEPSISPQLLIPVSSTPLLSSTTDYITGKIGDSIVLDANCSPGANNNVLWTKDNQPIKKDDSRIQIYYPNNSKCSLKIKNAKETDSGKYRATLKDNGEIITTTVEITPVPFAPVIQDFPQNVRVKQNDNINIVCVVNSFPFAQSAIWTVKPADGSPVRNLINNVRYKLINKPLNNTNGHMQKLELYFDNVTGSDAGEYCVRVENDAGWSSVLIPVLVSVVSEVQNKKCPPRFIHSLDKEIISPINENISMKCKLTGNPAPIMKWLKNNKDLTESNRVKIYKTGESHELVINNLQKSDSGLYEASASNTQGFQVTKCQLKVIESDNSVDSRFSPETPVSINLIPKDNREPNKINSTSSPQRTQMIFSNSIIRSPPQFITTFTDEVVKEGDDVVLKCCLIGYPEPVIWWSYNTHFINDARFEMKRELDEYYLYLRNIQKSDSGRYSITAENSSGLATCSALVIVDSHFNNTSIDRSKYPSNSRPLSRDVYSNALRSSMNDESKIMQASPRGWQEYQFHSNSSTPRSSKKFSDIVDGVQKPEQNISTTTTKTIKTYHYSGPSGVDLPGVGFIPKISHSVNNSSSSSPSSSSRSQIGVAKFVSGENKTSGASKFVPYPCDDDSSRFSVVESSDCDFPL